MKTSKQKAKELFDKYQIAGSQCYVDTTKKYALIAVDEIIKLIDSYKEEQYWLEVKQEIENL